MEKKVNKFYLLSAINLAPIAIMTGGFNRDFLILAAVLVILVVNHATLVRIVRTLTESMAGKPSNAGSPTVKLLLLFGLKFLLLALAIALVYYFNKNLIPKTLLLMIFQLIIQVVSIKNNYQK